MPGIGRTGLGWLGGATREDEDSTMFAFNNGGNWRRTGIINKQHILWYDR